MIAAVAVVIAVLGAVLLGILSARIRAVDAELKLKKHRCKDAGLADLLNYAAVDDGVVVGKNGSFMAASAVPGMTTQQPDPSDEMVSFGSDRRWPPVTADDPCRACASQPRSTERGRSHFRMRSRPPWTKNAACSRGWGRVRRLLRVVGDVLRADAGANQIRWLMFDDVRKRPIWGQEAAAGFLPARCASIEPAPVGGSEAAALRGNQ
jgi:hypothetical protein